MKLNKYWFRAKATHEGNNDEYGMPHMKKKLHNSVLPMTANSHGCGCGAEYNIVIGTTTKQHQQHIAEILNGRSDKKIYARLV